MGGEKNAWRCGVCGYVHRGSGPPEICPICGAPQDLFEISQDAPSPSSAPTPQNTWRCLICAYLHDGAESPDICPVCGAGASYFAPVEKADIQPAEATSGGPFVIIGGGIAGVAAAECLRRTSPQSEITLVSKETELPYFRLNLTRYLAGEIDARQLPMHPAPWYDQRNVRLALGVEASAIKPQERIVELSDGSRLPFGKLLIAAGAHPFVPPFAGTGRRGVTTLRTVEDADRILRAVEAGAKAVCIGGGILGLETAAALARRGSDVTLLEGHGWLLPRQLNRRAGQLLADHAAAKGITLRREARTREIIGDDHARGVLLEDDTVIPADLVVIATGVRANSHLARSAGLRVNRGVLVDDMLATSHPDVFAAGDVAEHRGVVYGIWGPAQSQGSIAAMNMATAPTEFGGLPRSNTLKVLGLNMFSIGQITAQDASFREMQWEDEDRYVRFLLQDGRLVGAILLGDIRLAAGVQRAVESRQDLSSFGRNRHGVEELLEFLGK